MDKVFVCQGNGPLRRGMKLFSNNEITGLVALYGQFLLLKLLYQIHLLEFFDHKSPARRRIFLPSSYSLLPVKHCLKIGRRRTHVRANMYMLMSICILSQ